MKEDWIKYLRDRMEGYQEPAPEGLWEEILSSLEHDTPDNAPRVLPKSRRRSTTWKRLAAAASLALLLSGGGYYIYNKVYRQDLKAPLVTDNRPKHEASQGDERQTTSPTARQEEPKTDLIPALLARIKAVGSHADAVMEQILADEHRPTTGPSENQEPAEPNEQDRQKAKSQDKESEHTSSKPVYRAPASNRRPYSTLAYGDSKGRNVRNSWSIGMHASNAVITSANTQGVMRPTMMNSYNTLYSMPDSRYGDQIRTYGNTNAPYTHEEKVEYDPPISLGATVNWRLTKRLSVESGLTYSKVTTTFKKRMGDDQLTDKQTLHYVGIPIKAKYDVWQSRHVSAYVSGGGEGAVNVSAKLESDATKRAIEKDRMQWSVGASAGIEYHATRQIGVYVEPGVVHYFNNGSNIQNIYKDRKNNLNVQFGIRISVK